MGKIAFVFPGQGAQKIGMAKDFYETSETTREIFEIASKASGLDVAKLCFEMEKELGVTEYTQIALLTVEVAILKEIEKLGLHPDVCAGLSLGEYAALAAADAMSLEDLFAVIRKRGIFMQEAYPVGGAMTAVLGMEADAVQKVLETIDGIVSIANDNCPGQLVISGEKEAVDKAAAALSENGAKRCIPLNVSGPFHSKLLETASKQLGEVLADVAINDIKVPYITNVTANVVEDKSLVKDLLTAQVSSGVRFRESILLMQEMGVDTFVEIGPGKTVCGFVKKVDRALNAMNVETVADLDKIKELL